MPIWEAIHSPGAPSNYAVDRRATVSIEPSIRLCPADLPSSTRANPVLAQQCRLAVRWLQCNAASKGNDGSLPPETTCIAPDTRAPHPCSAGAAATGEHELCRASRDKSGQNRFARFGHNARCQWLFIRQNPRIRIPLRCRACSSNRMNAAKSPGFSKIAILQLPRFRT